MTIAGLLKRVIDHADLKVQHLHEAAVGATSKRKPYPHTELRFVTTNMTPDDLLYWSDGLGQPDSRRPKYVGLVVWVPTEEYDRAAKEGR